MADTVKLIALGVAKGLQDGVFGAARLFYLDKELEAAQQNSSPSREPQSTLARRRAERMKTTPEKKKEKSVPNIMQRIVLCCMWNGGIFWASIILFNFIVIPCLRFFTQYIFASSADSSTIWTWLGPMLTWTFGALWILPLFILSKIVNSLWFQDIADAAYKSSRGRPNLMPSLSKVIADVLFSLLLQGLFLIQGMLANFLPIRGLGELVGLVHMCMLYSLYAFEYKWYNMGWEVHKRLSYMETQWPYFIGFGLPLAVLTSMPSSYVVSGCVFSILFPLFIISANEADAVQQSYCDFPLKLFAIVVTISNAIFQHTVTSKRPSSARSTPSSTPVKRNTTMK
ncbi:etoposide-induced protein 2.4 homolog [Tubulanus polymorphus]|uniref:etoposide-induced protein 2.4 homolog n=1 Tax=Tubulanus polymorphus TaxID=672921 RepID=UPI003DA5E255